MTSPRARPATRATALALAAVLLVGPAGARAASDTGKPSKSDKSGKAGKSDKPDKSDKADPSDKPASPGQTADALKLLDQGIELFKQNRLEEARTAFLKVRELVPDKANPYRWLGLAEARLGNCKEALANLDEFIKRVPGNDPRTIEAVTVRDRCKEDLAVKTGTLEVESSPSGAEVRLDKEDSPVLGTTPFTQEVVIGSHVVLLRKEGHEDVSKVFTLGKGEKVRLDVVLPVEQKLVAAPVDGATPTAAPPPKKSKLWVLGVVAGVVAAGALGLGLGLGLTADRPSENVFPSVAAF